MAETSTEVTAPALSDTAVQMLEVAERLFADKGIDRVSLREIVRASGQSNLSAAHYHFGSRESLIGTLLARRVRAINVLRHQRLDALVAAGRAGNAYAVAVTAVTVLGDAVRTMPWGPYYVRVIAQVLFNPDPQVLSHLDPQTMSGHTRAREMLRTLLPDLPARVFKDRIWMLNNQATFGIARWIQSHGPVTASNSRRYAAAIRNMADFLAAGMVAPVGGTVADDGADTRSPT